MSTSPMTILCVFAHPDDESFLVAGTVASLIDAGHEVTMVSATRGEAGEILAEDAATRDNLGDVRENELRSAMAELGVQDVRFLGYRDSGMAGTPENNDPRSLASAPVSEVASRVRKIIDELDPDIVITFGPEGVYRHPDHVGIHTATVLALSNMQAGEDTRPPDHVYYATTPREWILSFAGRSDGPFAEEPIESLEQMGTPGSEITTRVDVSNRERQKRRALLQHRTQFGDEDPLANFDDDATNQIILFEHFVRSPLSRPLAESESDPLMLANSN